MAAHCKPLLLDLHIPYCIRPQRYIRQFGEVGTNAQKDAYLEAMKREVLSYEGELENAQIRAVRLSGGSATVMSPDLLGEVLALVRRRLPVEQGAEVSFDALPNTIGTPSLTGIAAGHPTRAELMMRSECDAELRALDCPFTMQHTRNAVLFMRKFHLNNLGLTVNYGIPGQSMQSWHNTLHACVIMQPQHISAEPLCVTDAQGMPGEEERFAMYVHACEFLEENGYAQYAAGRFSLPHHEYLFEALRANGAEVIGMGVDAVTVFDGYVTRNTNNCALYIKNAGDFEKLTAQAAELSDALCMRRYAQGRMELTQGFLPGLFETRFETAVPQEICAWLETLVRHGLAEARADAFVPTRRGLFAAQSGRLDWQRSE